MYVCTCMCVCMYECMYVYVCICMYACMYVFITYVHVRMCVFCLKEARGLRLISECACLAFHPRSKFENTVNENYIQISGRRWNLRGQTKKTKGWNRKGIWKYQNIQMNVTIYLRIRLLIKWKKKLTLTLGLNKSNNGAQN